MSTKEQRHRIAALERKQRTVVSDDGYREERFTGGDGLPWVRYYTKGDWMAPVELPYNGNDNPMQELARMVEAGESKPSNLTPGESEMWDVILMGKIGKQIIQRIHAGETMPEDLTPNERECWELVEAVREKF